MSTDLQWLLIRNYNSFLVKRLPEGAYPFIDSELDITLALARCILSS